MYECPVAAPPQSSRAKPLAKLQQGGGVLWEMEMQARDLEDKEDKLQKGNHQLDRFGISRSRQVVVLFGVIAEFYLLTLDVRPVLPFVGHPREWIRIMESVHSTRMPSCDA